MNWRAVRFVFLLAFVAAASAASAQDSKAVLIDKCALALAPEITLINTSDSLKTSWLVLITKDTYEAAKKQISESGNADFLGLIGASGNASYEEFQEKRTKYLEHRSGTWDEQHALSVFRQNLPTGAGQNFVDCLKIALTRSDGVFAWFSQETADNATLHVSYRGTPNTQVRLQLQLTGGQGLPPAVDLPHDGESQFVVVRQSRSSETKVSVNSTALKAGNSDWQASRGLADTALSVRPPRAQPGPVPRFVVKELWSEANIGNPNSNCTYLIENRNIDVLGYDLTKGTNLELVVKGVEVVPAPGVYAMIVETGGQKVATRTLTDLSLGGGATIAIRGGGASAVLVIAPKVTKSCPHPKVRFTNANIVVSQPPAIYGESPKVSTEVVNLTQGGNYSQMNPAGSPVNCGQCGDLYAAELTGRLSEPVAKIVSVTFISKAGNWQRCSEDKTIDCTTASEFTVSPTPKSASCINASTCYVWRFQRHENQGGYGSDVISVAYHARRCERYCPW